VTALLATLPRRRSADPSVDICLFVRRSLRKRLWFAQKP